MKHPAVWLWLGAGACLTAWAQAPSTSVHLTYHWHLHQPIYWPEANPFAPQTNRYQFAGDSINLKLGIGTNGNSYPGSPDKHPRNQLVSGDGGSYDAVFDKADRVKAYQFGGRDSLNTISRCCRYWKLRARRASSSFGLSRGPAQVIQGCA